jgi:hypothetical protein
VRETEKKRMGLRIRKGTIGEESEERKERKDLIGW